jgi:uncharacterized protein YkwD
MKNRIKLRANWATSLASASLLAFPLAACGGSGSVGSAPVVIATPTPSSSPTPSPSPTPAPTPTPSPTPTPTPTSWSAAAAAMYDVQPDIAGCRTGTLKASVRAEMLARLNALRALHNLPAVTHSDADNAQVDESSLMQAANNTLSHTPPTSWLCYTATGSTGAGSSNLIGGWGTGLRWSSEDAYLGLWLTEGGSASIGHRRWILDPFLGKIAYGRVAQQLANGSRSDAASMKVFGFAATPPTPTGLPAYVAYPFGDYPVRYFGTGDYLSFSVVASASSRGANGGVSFSGATVTVSNGSTNLAVTDVTSDNQGYGLPNSIQWRVTGLATNTTYTVRITGVTGAPQTSYEYTFKVVL